MPVWHDLTRAARAAGELTIVGITQEQHPDRCRLFAQWQGFDWPILWDPFNLTESSAVPIVLAVDESGRIREKPSPRTFRASFLEADFGQLQEPLPPAPEVLERYAREAGGLAAEGIGGEAREGGLRARSEHAQAIARLLFASGSWRADEPRQAALEFLRMRVAAQPDDARARFELGVALRLRYDQDGDLGLQHPEDFQESLDAWRAALDLDPAQYIWRRRIQQYGPRLDKPYPFYDWVERARSELIQRGRTPSPLLTALTGSELAGGTNAFPNNLGESAAPDPKRQVPLDQDGLLRIEFAVAAHTDKPGARVPAAGAARVHLTLRPDAAREVHWGDEAGPTLVWVATPRGWRIERNLFSIAAPEGELASSRARRVDFEVVAPELPDSGEPGPSQLRGYALYNLCEGASGACVYYRQDFEVSVPRPTSPKRRED